MLSTLVFMVLYRHHGGFYYRTVVTMICMAICALYGVFASLVLPLFGRGDLINWSVARAYYNLAGFFTGISVEIEGKEHLKKNQPTVFVCNHQSSMDVLFMASVFPKATSVVAKKAIKYYPFLGWYSKSFFSDHMLKKTTRCLTQEPPVTLSKAIFLDRKNRESAIKEAKQAAEDIHNKKVTRPV